MKPIHFLAAFVLGISGLTYAAGDHDHGHEHKPLHGGIVSEVKDMDYELVAKPEVIQLYLRDHGKPVDVSKASAKLTILVGMEKQEAELKPAGDRLESPVVVKTSGGAKVVALVMIPGKPVTTVRFVVK